MKKYIGEKETMWLFAILQTSRFAVDAIHNLVVQSYGAAFLSILLGGAFILLVWFLYATICHTVKDNIFTRVERLSSKAVKIAVGVVLFAISVINASFRLRTFVYAVGKNVLPSSPLAFVLIIFAFAVASCVYFGMEPVSRYSLASGVGVFVLCAVVGAFGTVQCSRVNLGTVLGGGGVVKSGFQSVLYFSDVLYLFVISDYFKSALSVYKIGFKSTAISIVFSCVVALIFVSAVGYPLCAQSEYPLFELSRLAKTSVVFQRLDGIVYVVWLFLGFVSCGALCLFCTEIFAEISNAKDRRGISPVVTFLVFAFALSGIEISATVKNICLIFVLILPVIIGICERVKACDKNS